MPRMSTVICNLNFAIGTRTHRDLDMRKHDFKQIGAKRCATHPLGTEVCRRPPRGSTSRARSPMPPTGPSGPAPSGSPPVAALPPALRPSTTLQHVAAAALPRCGRAASLRSPPRPVAMVPTRRPRLLAVGRDAPRSWAGRATSSSHHQVGLELRTTRKQAW